MIRAINSCNESFFCFRYSTVATHVQHSYNLRATKIISNAAKVLVGVLMDRMVGSVGTHDRTLTQTTFRSAGTVVSFETQMCTSPVPRPWFLHKRSH